MATELVIEASTATLVVEMPSTTVLEIGAPGPQGASAVLADGVTSVTLRTASGAEFALSVDDDGLLTTTRL
jgi:hypothetical protein